MTDFDEDRMQRFLKKVIIKDWVVTFIFYNNVGISKTYTNGKSGNQPGWKDKLKQEESK